LTSGEAAAILGVSTATLDRLAHERRLGFTRYANGWRRYDEADLHALRERSRVDHNNTKELRND